MSRIPGNSNQKNSFLLWLGAYLPMKDWEESTNYIQPTAIRIGIQTRLNHIGAEKQMRSSHLAPCASGNVQAPILWLCYAMFTII